MSEQHVCPWWLGYLLASPIRKLIQNPQTLLKPYIKEGMTILDFGSAMGFFSIPAAEITGTEGKVICVDLQEKMLASLKKRVEKKGLSQRMVLLKCSYEDTGLKPYINKINLALLFAVAHEVADKESLFADIYNALVDDGKLIFSEPSGHLSKKDFDEEVAVAEKTGFIVESGIKIKNAYSVILKKK